MIETELITACYRIFLGREPENEDVLRDKIARLPTYEDLLREFLGSSEFRNRLHPLGLTSIADLSLSVGKRIDVSVSSQQRDALFARLRSQWRMLGERDPFWSVLTHDEYRVAVFDRSARERFYNTGEDFSRLIDAYCHRNHVELPNGVCLELGCGVGRVTMHLAKRFRRVIAIDISEGNLAKCKLMAEQEKLKNIDTFLLTSPDQLKAIDRFDLFYSTLTLQHNPPPVQQFMLRTLLKHLNNRGLFLFQTQTLYPEYSFVCDEYLASPIGTMDMHSLPMQEIFRVIQELVLTPLEISIDTFTGRPGSYTFFGSRPASNHSCG